MKLTFNQKRLGAGILLFIALLSAGNQVFEWGMFGRFGKQVMIGAFAVIWVYLFNVGPTLEEVQEYRDRKNRE